MSQKWWWKWWQLLLIHLQLYRPLARHCAKGFTYNNSQPSKYSYFQLREGQPLNVWVTCLKSEIKWQSQTQIQSLHVHFVKHGNAKFSSFRFAIWQRMAKEHHLFLSPLQGYTEGQINLCLWVNYPNSKVPEVPSLTSSNASQSI